MLTQEQKAEIANELLGSCSSTIDLVDQFNAEDELEIGIAAEEYGVYNCDICGWWVDDYESTDMIKCRECLEDE